MDSLGSFIVEDGPGMGQFLGNIKLFNNKKPDYNQNSKLLEKLIKEITQKQETFRKPQEENFNWKDIITVLKEVQYLNLYHQDCLMKLIKNFSYMQQDLQEEVAILFYKFLLNCQINFSFHESVGNFNCNEFWYTVYVLINKYSSEDLKKGNVDSFYIL